MDTKHAFLSSSEMEAGGHIDRMEQLSRLRMTTSGCTRRRIISQPSARRRCSVRGQPKWLGDAGSGSAHASEARTAPRAVPPVSDTLMTFSALPLAYGWLIGFDLAEAAVRINKIEVVITSRDGVQTLIPLVERDGSWWPPGSLSQEA